MVSSSYRHPRPDLVTNNPHQDHKEEYLQSVLRRWIGKVKGRQYSTSAFSSVAEWTGSSADSAVTKSVAGSFASRDLFGVGLEGAPPITRRFAEASIA
jgi:hypothetical protein